MQKLTTTSNSDIKTLSRAVFSSRGMLLAVVLIILTEAFFNINREGLTNDYWNQFILQENALIEESPDADYLILGNSIQKTGIRVKEVHPGLVSLGLPGGKPMDHYLLLKRWLKHHKPPKAVFIFLDPEEPFESSLVILRYFIGFGEFLSIKEDLSRTEAGTYLGKFFASIDNRKVNLSLRDPLKESPEQFKNSMIANGGFKEVPHPNRMLPENAFETDTLRLDQEMTFTPRDRKYLDELIEFCRARKIQIAFIGIPMPEAAYDRLKEKGFVTDYERLLQVIAGRHQEVTPAVQPLFPLGHEFFSDTNHLNAAGAEYYTQYFKKGIFEPYIEVNGDDS